MNLNQSKWKEFVVGSLFSKPDVLKYSATPESEGNIPFITSTAMNNGTSQLCGESPVISKCITVSTNGNCFDTFYHEEPICVSNDVEVLVNDALSMPQMMFICTILQQESMKYNYGRKPKNGKVWNTIIKLPIQHHSDGTPVIDPEKKYSKQGYIPDWQFMENYIKSLHYKPLTTSRTHVPKKELNVSKWKEFCMATLFDSMYKGEAYTDEDLESIDSSVIVPYITRTDLNNGCKYMAKITNDFHIEAGNAITIGDTTATCFYQKDKFITGDHIVILRAEWLNLLRGLFLIGLLNQEKLKYSYGRAYKIDNIKKTLLKLPIQHHPDGTPVIDPEKKYSQRGYIPDWQFMEDYINTLPYSDKIQ